MKKMLKALLAVSIATSSITTMAVVDMQASAKSTKKYIVEDVTKDETMMYLGTTKKSEGYYAYAVKGKIQLVDEFYGTAKVVKNKKIIDQHKKTYVIKNGLVYYKNKKFTGTYKTSKMIDGSWTTLKLKNGKVKKVLISYYTVVDK